MRNATAEKMPTPSALEQLISDRREVAGEIGRLQAVMARLSEANAQEAAVIAEIGALGAAEIDAMKAWVAGDCEGDQPGPNMKERTRLSASLANASAAATAARTTADGINQQLVDASARFAKINAKVDAAVLDVLEAERRDLLIEQSKIAHRHREVLARIDGLRFWLAQSGRDLVGQGRQDQATPFFRRAEAMSAVTTPDARPSPDDIGAAVEAWKQRAQVLRGSS